MGVALQNLQVRCSLGVWVCRPNSMSSLWLEHRKRTARGQKCGRPVFRYDAVWKDV